MKPSLEENNVLSAPMPRLSRPLMPAPPRARSLRHHLAVLVQASDLEELVPRVIRAAQEVAQARSAFLVFADPVAQHLDWTTARTENGALRGALVRELLAA